MTTNFDDDVGLKDFGYLLDEDPFAGGVEQTGDVDVSSSDSTFFTSQSSDPTYPTAFPKDLNLDVTFTPEYGGQPSSDWIFPANLSPYTELESTSSCDSNGIYHEYCWNPFDFPLSGVNSSITNNGAFVSRNPYSSLNSSEIYGNEYSNTNDISYVNLNSIHEPLDTTPFEYTLETTNPETLMQRQRTSQLHSKPTSPAPARRLKTRTRTGQPAWGQSRSRGSSSSTSSLSQNQNQNCLPRIPLQKEKPQKRESISLSRGPSLRSTTGTYRTGTSSSLGTFSTLHINTNTNTKTETENPHPRLNSNSNPHPKTKNTHNQIEKQYRNRLNAHFELLLSSILQPPSTVPPSSNLPKQQQQQPNPETKLAEAEAEVERKISKAEVLDMAQKHIRRLEREGRDLESENTVLRRKVEELNRVWVESGGIVLS